MTIAAWTIIVLLFAVGMAGAVYPILPGALAIYAAFFVYGFMIGWEPFGMWFWIVQTTLVAVLMVADYAVNALGVKKFGGKKASVIGSTIGLILGPFLIPVVGLLIGPFLGAVIGELVTGTELRQAVRAGVGALVGFFSGLVTKVLLQGLMIVLFIAWLVF
ncbi:DUF456 domain-containing protein [Paenibacillus mucilaginosus]|uniref:YqgC n=3 Tax=Paenibacillus mucilaginosus TaxID=61624 RepID=H6NC15_9BACL|nr:DUF456 family protein [Paenibacillus mucilaginosus]AEI42259.1 conserved hypothetical protein [Paenibacillus mucilaginosus KNP414]AFC28047.1 hypothetical protein PM3016_1115 [Paenibacillus mucilaginosus 3016]AFH60217.1 hypothetical protein B2K_05670 [Paenibacillus mucilaginosus K02]MCG7214220.1 DUF456 family protein [Paenibacillus mucilaginosus]WDM28732.1 DUF456 family protein [Paenibacillus mucilaginosus]